MREYWIDLAARFGVPRATGLGGGVEYTADIEAEFEALGFTLSGRVLDIGCGTGRLARLVVGEYLGLDITPEMVAYAQAAGRNARLISGPDDIDGQWDRVCMLSVLTHVPQGVRESYLAAVARVLAPSGEAVLDVFAGEGGGLDFSRTPDFPSEIAATGLEVVSTFVSNYDGTGNHVLHRVRR